MNPALRRAIIASRSYQPIAEEPVIALAPSSDPGPTPPTALHVVWYEDRAVTVEKIKAAVSKATGISVLDMVSERKPDPIALARQIAMYLAKAMTARSLAAIGRSFGNRDHSTVYHAVHKIEAMVAADPSFAARIEAIKESINA